MQLQLRAVLEVYFDTYGDKNPAKNEIHMPCFVDKKDLYDYIMQEPAAKKVIRNQEFSLKTFEAMLCTHFPHVKFPCFTRYFLHL